MRGTRSVGDGGGSSSCASSTPSLTLRVRRIRKHALPRPDDVSLLCGLCGRPFPREQLTKHHCLPKAKGGTVDHVELLCRPCHGMIHATFTNQTLAALYPSIEQLRTAPELAKFL